MKMLDDGRVLSSVISYGDGGRAVSCRTISSGENYPLHVRLKRKDLRLLRRNPSWWYCWDCWVLGVFSVLRLKLYCFSIVSNSVSARLVLCIDIWCMMEHLLCMQITSREWKFSAPTECSCQYKYITSSYRSSYGHVILWRRWRRWRTPTAAPPVWSVPGGRPATTGTSCSDGCSPAPGRVSSEDGALPWPCHAHHVSSPDTPGASQHSSHHPPPPLTLQPPQPGPAPSAAGTQYYQLLPGKSARGKLDLDYIFPINWWQQRDSKWNRFWNLISHSLS